jgi:hypothetical protein
VPYDHIKLDDIALPPEAGAPVNVPAKHAPRTLAGIDLEFSARMPQDEERVENLFAKDKVVVEDPFTDRSYEAVVTRRSTSYTEGSGWRRYTAEVRELDLVPNFEMLEVDGERFTVADYFEDEPEEDAVGRHALLRLSDEEFESLRAIMRRARQEGEGRARIRRVGVDEEPIEVRYGGAMYWSRHEEEGRRWYKQIVRFFPVDLPGPSYRIASGVEQDILADMVFKLSVRFRALADELVEKGVLEDDRRWELLDGDPASLLDDERLSKIRREFERVRDAAEHLD